MRPLGSTFALAFVAWLAVSGCRIVAQPVPGSPRSYRVSAIELTIPQDCVLTLDVRLQQLRTEPGGGTRDANVSLRLPEVAPTPTLNLGTIDLTAPLTVWAEIRAASGPCEQFVPPARWEFTGTVELDSGGAFAVRSSQFTLVFRPH